MFEKKANTIQDEDFGDIPVPTGSTYIPPGTGGIKTPTNVPKVPFVPPSGYKRKGPGEGIPLELPIHRQPTIEDYYDRRDQERDDSDGPQRGIVEINYSVGGYLK